jgi:hypothetical protein
VDPVSWYLYLEVLYLDVCLEGRETQSECLHYFQVILESPIQVSPQALLFFGSFQHLLIEAAEVSDRLALKLEVE